MGMYSETVQCVQCVTVYSVTVYSVTVYSTYCAVTVPLLFRDWMYPSSKAMINVQELYSEATKDTRSKYTEVCETSLTKNLRGKTNFDWKSPGKS